MDRSNWNWEMCADSLDTSPLCSVTLEEPLASLSPCWPIPERGRDQRPPLRSTGRNRGGRDIDKCDRNRHIIEMGKIYCHHSPGKLRCPRVTCSESRRMLSWRVLRAQSGTQLGWSCSHPGTCALGLPPSTKVCLRHRGH